MPHPGAATYPVEVTDELLEDVVRRIVERFHPERVILFGSYAWGRPEPDSDVDLMVVMDSDERPATRSAEISMACRPRFLPMDILVRTPVELERRLRMNDPFVLRIVEEGRVLYER
jgi:predicted nucleotidyltransferase